MATRTLSAELWTYTLSKTTWLATYRPTVERVCVELGVPFAVCLAQMRTEAGSGKGVLGQNHNHWGLKYPKGKSAAARLEAMGHPGKIEKMTGERLVIRSDAHIVQLNRIGAVFRDEPVIGESCRIRLPQLFCAWPTLEAGVRGWAAFVTSSRYDDGGVFADDPARWFAYRWAKGYATARRYVEANVKNVNKLSDVTGVHAVIDEGLERFLDAARELHGRARWEFTNREFERDQLGRAVEVMDFSDEPMVITPEG